jgi:arabinogalactan oligomer/maltooligosaccharide transport system substrate-binding protein
VLLVGCTASQGSGSSTADTDLAAAPGVGVDRPRSPQPIATTAPRADLVIWAPPDVAAALRPRVEDFGRTRGVTVTVESVSDVRSALEDVTAPESGPDVFLGPHIWLGEMEQQRAIRPVRLSRDQQRRLAPKAVAAVRYDGRLWGVPYAIANVALVRNTDLAPEAPKTYEQLIATGRRLKADGKVNRILLQTTGSTGDVYSGYPYLRAYGGGIFAHNVDVTLTRTVVSDNLVKGGSSTALPPWRAPVSSPSWDARA